MLDGLMSRLGMTSYGLISLVLFFSAFVGIVVWTMTRSKREIERQSNLWQDDED